MCINIIMCIYLCVCVCVCHFNSYIILWKFILITTEISGHDWFFSYSILFCYEDVEINGLKIQLVASIVS